MAQQEPEKTKTLDQVLNLVSRLTPEEQGKLRRKLDELWSEEWRAFFNELDQRNKGVPPLSEEEIKAEIKAVRKGTEG